MSRKKDHETDDSASSSLKFRKLQDTKGMHISKSFNLRTLGLELQNILRAIQTSKDKKTLARHRQRLDQVAGAVRRDEKLYAQTQIYLKYLYEKLSQAMGEDRILD